MSANKFNNKFKKPFCKVCQDAGKPESDYTSHYVRSLPDKYGKTTVTCPTLAATECRYCYQLGHTAKFCSVLEDNKKKAEKAKSEASKAKQREERAAVAPKVEVKEKKYTGAFSILGEDSDDEAKPVKVAKPFKVAEPVKVVEDFPTLGDKKAVEYANYKRIEKAAEGLWMENRSILHNISTITHPVNSWSEIAAKPAAPVYKPAPPKVDAKVSFATKSWADYSDSDTEEDEDDFPPMPTKTKEESDDEWDNLPVLTRTASVYQPASSLADDDW